MLIRPHFQFYWSTSSLFACKPTMEDCSILNSFLRQNPQDGFHRFMQCKLQSWCLSSSEHFVVSCTWLMQAACAVFFERNEIVPFRGDVADPWPFANKCADGAVKPHGQVESLNVGAAHTIPCNGSNMPVSTLRTRSPPRRLFSQCFPNSSTLSEPCQNKGLDQRPIIIHRSRKWTLSRRRVSCVWKIGKEGQSACRSTSKVIQELVSKVTHTIPRHWMKKSAELVACLSARSRRKSSSINL